MRYTHTLSLLAALFPACATVSADTVRWINAAGGSFEDGANWDRGTAPGGSDIAQFDLAATYTVVMTSGGTKGALLCAEGNVTLDMTGRTVTLGSMTVGSTGGMPGTLHMAGGTLTTGYLLVYPASTFDIQGASISGGGSAMALYAGSALTMNGGFLSMNQCNVTGATLTIVGGGWMSVNVMHTPAASSFLVTGANSRLSGDGLFFIGNLNIENGGKVFTGQGVPVSLAACQARVSGVNSAISAGGAVTSDLASTLTIESGGVSSYGVFNGPVNVNPGGSVTGASTMRALVTVGPNGRVPAGAYYAGLRVDHASIVNTGILERLEGSLTVDIDGLSTRTTPLLSLFSACPIIGPLTINVRNGNALRVGRTIPIAQYDSGINQTSQNFFSSLTAPPLGGGRALSMVNSGTPRLISVNVVPGGAPCWSSDFDGDGDYGTDADIEAFFACLGGNCCPICASVDFNSDGDTGTDADIESFFRILAGGAC